MRAADEAAIRKADIAWSKTAEKRKAGMDPGEMIVHETRRQTLVGATKKGLAKQLSNSVSIERR